MNVSLIVAGGTAVTFNVAAGTTFTVPDGTYAGGTTFNVGAGATVTIAGGTFTGGAIFNVGTGRSRRSHGRRHAELLGNAHRLRRRHRAAWQRPALSSAAED